jgi:hypothetical protein
MDHNVSLDKLPPHFFTSRAEMIDPNRCVGENQFARILLARTLLSRDLRRGTFFNLGIVPPKEANLRALSRSMSALRASRTNAVFSTTPVNS